MEDIKDTNIDTEVVETEVDESTVETTETEDKKYLKITQEDLNAIMEKKVAQLKRVAEAEKIEAEKLAAMGEKERTNAIYEKREGAADERERMLDIREALTESGLKAHLIKRFKYSTVETIQEDIEEYKAEIKEAVSEELNKTLKGTTPKTGSGQTLAMTKDEFNKLGYKEQTKMFTENRPLYDKLIK